MSFERLRTFAVLADTLHFRETAEKLHVSQSAVSQIGVPLVERIGRRTSGKPSSTIAFERRWNPLLKLSEAEFVEQVGGDVPPKPEGMAEIMRWNQGRA